MEYRLSEVKPGTAYKIKCILPCSIKNQLLEMGFCKDCKIEIVRFAPLNDPLECRIQDDFSVGLRRSEAWNIILEKLV